MKRIVIAVSILWVAAATGIAADCATEAQTASETADCKHQATYVYTTTDDATKIECVYEAVDCESHTGYVYRLTPGAEPVVVEIPTTIKVPTVVGIATVELPELPELPKLPVVRVREFSGIYAVDAREDAKSEFSPHVVFTVVKALAKAAFKGITALVHEAL